MLDVDGVACQSRHLVAGFQSRRDRIVAVEAAGAGLRNSTVDALIGAAAAEMSRQRGGDLLARGHSRTFGRAPVVMEGSGFHDIAGRAEAALQRVVRHEGLLHRMQSGGAYAFDRDQRFAAGCLRRQQAAHDGRAVEQHGAGAADAGAADELGAGEPAVADYVDHERIRIVG